jgi:hypothetical protein
VVAIRGSLVDREPVVRRVRQFLESVERATPYEVNKDRTGRPQRAYNHGHAERTLVEGDLEDIEARLRRVREALPDLQVEESPHLVRARAGLGRVGNSPRDSGEEAWTGRCGGAT